jgi:hypothetical protein
VQAVTWQDGKPAPYLLIARAFAAMEGTTKRLKKDEIMVDAFRAILKRCPGDSSAPACLPLSVYVFSLDLVHLYPCSALRGLIFCFWISEKADDQKHSEVRKSSHFLP